MNNPIRNDWGFKTKIQLKQWKKPKPQKLACVLDYEREPKPLNFSNYGEYSSLNQDLDLALNPEIKLTKEEKAIKNLNQCSKRWTTLGGCGCAKPTTIHIQTFCGIRYHKDKECVNSRYDKAHIKLTPLFELLKQKKVKELYMVCLGSNRLPYEIIQKSINQWAKTMRKKYGYRLCFIKVQDISNPNNHFFHFHLYLLTEKMITIKLTPLFIARATKVLKQINPEMVYSQGGFTPLENCKGYMAKRIAGIFGEIRKGGHFFFEDFMNFETYLKTFHNKKSLSYSRNLPKIWNITRNARLLLEKKLVEKSRKRCFNCENPLEWVKSGFYPDKPPDT